MTPDLLTRTLQLSKADRKNLVEKTLKTVEEVGELAKAILPYANAHGTLHRFVEREKILEEVVDTLLTSLSVAYDLNFSDAEIQSMFTRKLDKWEGLQRRELECQPMIPFEVHITITIDSSALPSFVEICTELNVKPIILSLYVGTSQVCDVMTSSKFKGTNREVYEYTQQLVKDLQSSGFTTARAKIETFPWHPAAPRKGMPMPIGCYFESHVPVKLRSTDIPQLRELTKSLGAHCSRNIRKQEDQGKVTIMVTHRDYSSDIDVFNATVGELVSKLKETYDVGSIITEFAIYDTNRTHDNAWIASQ